jgi:uncharacterized protein YjeT (DUF2065 family)
MTDFLVALALVMVIEGFLYALFPEGMKRMMEVLLIQSSERIRSAGLVFAVIGVGLVWLLRG